MAGLGLPGSVARAAGRLTVTQPQGVRVFQCTEEHGEGNRLPDSTDTCLGPTCDAPEAAAHDVTPGLRGLLLGRRLGRGAAMWHHHGHTSGKVVEHCLGSTRAALDPAAQEGMGTLKSTAHRGRLRLENS